jgi:hypothetical protein
MKKYTYYIFVLLLSIENTMGQSLDSALSFYPLNYGDQWIYDYLPNYLPANPILYSYSISIQGDTLMNNSKVYKKRARQVLPDGPITYTYERIDSSNACVFIYDSSAIIGEVLFDSLLAEPNSVAGSIGVYDYLNVQVVFANPVMVRHYGFFTSPTYELAAGIGISYIRELSGPTQLPFVHYLRYANINGKEYHLVTSVEMTSQQLPKQKELFQNYPNPFNPSTQISFSLHEKTSVILSIYDNIGREVATLTNGLMELGMHTVTFDGSGLPSGVYYYRLKAGLSSSTKRMVLIK